MSCTFSSCKLRATLHSSSRLPLHSHHMAQHTNKIACGPCRSAKTASIMQTPSKKSTTKDVKDDATQQGHKRSKCSNNGGTTAMQIELVEAAMHQKVISAPIQRRLSPPAFNSSRYLFKCWMYSQ